MFKTIVAGCRNYKNRNFVDKVLNNCPWTITEVVSGKCRGVDQLGEEWARDNQIDIKNFPYEEDAGLAGGPIRNEKMAQYADAAIVFSSGGKGSSDMIQRAIDHKLHLIIVWI